MSVSVVIPSVTLSNNIQVHAHLQRFIISWSGLQFDTASNPRNPPINTPRARKQIKVIITIPAPDDNGVLFPSWRSRKTRIISKCDFVFAARGCWWPLVGHFRTSLGTTTVFAIRGRAQMVPGTEACIHQMLRRCPFERSSRTLPRNVSSVFCCPSGVRIDCYLPRCDTV